MAGGGIRYVPPAGFNAATATDAQLQQYGIPSRPTDPSDMAQWDKMVANMHFVIPPAFLAETHSHVDTHSGAGVFTSGNWSGFIVFGSSGQFTEVKSYYYEPTFYGSRCSTNSEVTWAGLGGDAPGKNLAQDGTLYHIPGAVDHEAWSEVLPENIIPQPLVGSPGALFQAYTQRISGGIHFYMHDYASGGTLSYNDYTYPNNYDGTSAEWIAERPTINGVLTNLSNFSTLDFKNDFANGYKINDWNHDAFYMYNGNDLLAKTSNLYDGGHFYDTQTGCN